jgi:hypothetical protein
MTRKYFVKEGNGVTSEYSSKAAYKRIKKRAKVFGAMKARNWKALREAERDGNVQAIIDAATYAIRFYNNRARFPQTIRHVFQFGNKTAKNPETFWPILSKGLPSAWATTNASSVRATLTRNVGVSSRMRSGRAIVLPFICFACW